MNEITGVRRYLEMIAAFWEVNGTKQKSTERFLLEHGQAFTPAELPGHVQRGKMKQCFLNASRLALSGAGPDHPRPIYCEGFAIPACVGISLHHAWCCDEFGNVIDPTWEDSPRCQYFGIPFRGDFLCRILTRSKMYGLLDCPTLSWPLQRGKFKPEEFRAELTERHVSAIRGPRNEKVIQAS